MPDAAASPYLHATAVVVGEAGVLIRGPAGSGKSSLALRLIAEAERRGLFARLVGDDRVAVEARHGLFVVRPHPAIAGLMERRSLPFATVPNEAGCVIRLVVDLVEAPLPRLPDGAPDNVVLCDAMPLPLLRLAARRTDLNCLFILQQLKRA